jgi:AcrR family transcriptional regulator
VTDTSTTRERILFEASTLFAKQGYHRTSTREIAAAVGIRQPSLFYHFSSKAEIMRVLLHEALDGAVAAAERQLAAEGSPAARLRRYIVEDLMSLCRSPYNLAGTTTAAVLADPDFADIEARYRNLFDARTRLIQRGIDGGEFIVTSAEFASRAIEWVIEGLNTDLGMDRPDELESVIGEAADFCVRALLVDCSRLDEIR